MDAGGLKPTITVAGDVPSSLPAAARALGWAVANAAVDAPSESVALALVDREQDIDALRDRYGLALIVTADAEVKGPDLTVPDDVAPHTAEQLLRHADSHWRNALRLKSLTEDVQSRRNRTRQLSEIGIALSSQMELQELLSTILTEARRIAECEAGSLYLIETRDGDDALVFKLTQNDAIDVPLADRDMPVSTDSLAGYVAATGETLNLTDAYQTDQTAPYSFNDTFDLQTGYRTRSVLVLPMRDHRDQVIGVLQFINRVEFDASGAPVPAFGDEITELLRAVASQAAVSIQKNTLISDINNLFESFVQASVRAIEKRDPTTSGHSFRVAETTVGLMQALPRSGRLRFSEPPSETHLKEIRYAALLHDFGKVGVREYVLVKPRKISDERLQIIGYRIELAKERLRRRALEQEYALIHGDADVLAGRRTIHKRLDREISELDSFYDAVKNANNPSVVLRGDFSHLQQIAEYPYREKDGTISGLIDAEDLLALSVRRGSLTPEEHREIQAHVGNTREFLAALPWPPELEGIPTIAGGHHEKLDGSGYPQGLIGDQIPVATRAMTVCDIYDALTANDRPYKAAIPKEAAFDILREEADAGLLDLDIVDVFIESLGHVSQWQMPYGAAEVVRLEGHRHGGRPH